MSTLPNATITELLEVGEVTRQPPHLVAPPSRDRKLGYLIVMFGQLGPQEFSTTPNLDSHKTTPAELDRMLLVDLPDDAVLVAIARGLLEVDPLMPTCRTVGDVMRAMEANQNDLHHVACFCHEPWFTAEELARRLREIQLYY